MSALAASAVAMRPMREEDLSAVIAIERSAYEFPWTPGIFLDCLRAGYPCWLLARGAEILGYSVLSVGAEEAHLLNLCVAPAYQGQGHGGRLLARMLDLARWHAARRVYLEVRPSNPVAVGLYHRTGFNEIGTRTDYYPAKNGREDAVVMAKELLPPE